MGRFWLLACLAGCYQPHPVGGTCTQSSECPPGLDCVGGVCGGSGGGDDAGTDAPTIKLVPSNGIERDLAAKATGALAVDNGEATFDTDTGKISGAFSRGPVEGVDHGIYFERRPNVGVFVTTSLDVATNGSIKLTGGRAAIILVATTATIDGTIDGSAGANAAADAGPGGDAGTLSGAMNTGTCNHGGTGETGLPDMSTGDAGGGGGGGGTSGGAGGAAGTYLGGSGGTVCIVADLQPLVGGGGGGGGGPGLVTVGASGGGGGGALQLTALGSISLDGTISMAGAGGEGGPGNATNGSGGGGGGAGGGILLEAITIEIGPSALLAANGGGGGGGASTATPGMPGDNGPASATDVAAGGAPGSSAATAGGVGGGLVAPMAAAMTGSATNNAGGGGGAAGRIFLRSYMPGMLTVAASPAPGTGAIVTQ